MQEKILTTTFEHNYKIKQRILALREEEQVTWDNEILLVYSLDILFLYSSFFQIDFQAKYEISSTYHRHIYARFSIPLSLVTEYPSTIFCPVVLRPMNELSNNKHS
jgi:hypothetical protein